MSERRPGLENYMEIKHSVDTMLASDAHDESGMEDNLKQIGALLDLAKVFDLDGDLKDLLMSTENEIGDRRHPYPVYFIDTSFSLVDKDGEIREYHGLLVWSGDAPVEEKQTFTSAYTATSVRKKLNRNERKVEKIYDEFYVSDVFKKFQDDSRFNFQETTEREDEQKDKLRLFLVNFLDFLNNPEVETVEREPRVKSPEERGKSHSACPYCGKNLADARAVNRHIQRKHPDRKPETRVCKLTGKTKRYVRRYRQLGRRQKRSVRRHWVRGHWRHFPEDSEFFTEEKRGTKTWIPPHVRGEGVLVPKKYEVEEEG